MDAFPAFFPLAGRKVVVVGAGEAADNKARLFDGSPATLVLRNKTDRQMALIHHAHNQSRLSHSRH